MPSLQLDEVELSQALGALSAHKAVPAHLAPVAACKLCATELIPHLLRIANRFTAAPALWHEAWWALLPKVTKPTLPKHLRPIGLSEVSSRVVGKVLQNRLRPYYVEEYLRDLPQWAYTPGRGTLDAALRVQAHCQDVVADCQPDSWTVREARAGLPRPANQLSLDLSAAFDTLEWCHMRRLFKTRECQNRYSSTSWNGTGTSSIIWRSKDSVWRSLHPEGLNKGVWSHL